MEQTLEHKPHILRLFFLLAKPHKRDPRLLSVPSRSFRQLYRLLAKSEGWSTSTQAEQACFASLYARSADYSRTQHYTRRARWLPQETFQAPSMLSRADLPEVPEDCSPVLDGLISHYDTLTKGKGSFYVALYALALRLAQGGDYLANLREFFQNDEVWSSNTLSFWNTGFSSLLLNSKTTRSLLFSGKVKGYDISNCFPVLLSQALDRGNIPHCYIRSYAQNRVDLIEQIMTDWPIPSLAKPSNSQFEQSGLTRDKAKKTMLATLFGQKRGKADHPILKGLSGEVKEIREKHFQGSARQMSYALYRILGEIQLQSRAFFGDDLIGTVCDCFYIRQTSTKTMQGFADHISEILGYDITLSEKD